MRAQWWTSFALSTLRGVMALLPSTIVARRTTCARPGARLGRGGCVGGQASRCPPYAPVAVGWMALFHPPSSRDEPRVRGKTPALAAADALVDKLRVVHPTFARRRRVDGALPPSSRDEPPVRGKTPGLAAAHAWWTSFALSTLRSRRRRVDGALPSTIAAKRTTYASPGARLGRGGRVVDKLRVVHPTFARHRRVDGALPSTIVARRTSCARPGARLGRGGGVVDKLRVVHPTFAHRPSGGWRSSIHHRRGMGNCGAALAECKRFHIIHPCNSGLR